MQGLLRKGVSMQGKDLGWTLWRPGRCNQKMGRRGEEIEDSSGEACEEEDELLGERSESLLVGRKPVSIEL